MSGRSVEKLTDTEEYGVIRVHIRGKLYVMREMEAETYEEALRSAAILDEDGVATDRTDMLMFEKLLATGSVHPDDGSLIDLEAWNKLPHPVANRLLTEVKRLHWVDIQTDEEIEAAKKAAAEEKKKGGKKEPTDVPNS